MDSRSTNLLRAAVAVALSAVAFWFGTGLHPIWWATWLASIPVLIVAPRLNRSSAFAAPFLAHILGNLNWWTYTSLLPLVAHLLFAGIPAVGFGLSVLLFRATSIRGKLWQTWLSFPSAWVAYEYIIAHISPHGTFGNLAYDQMNFLPGIQIASLTGIEGITFCLSIFSSTIAIATDPKFRTAPRTRLVFALTLLGLAGSLGFGFWRVQHTPTEPSVKVGLIAADDPWASLQGANDPLAIFRRYLAEVPALAKQGAEVVLTPEYVGDFSANPSADKTTELNELFSTTARNNHVTIEVGLGRIVDPHTQFNEIRVYSPAGDVAVYEKHHLLPGYEDRFTIG